MEVMVTEKGITLNSLVGGSSNPSILSNVIGSTFKLDDLVKLLRDAACDIFPDDDAFCYIDTSCEKNYVMEMHIYSCLSCFALSHNFSWSRWNFAAGSRTCVLLMRELLEMRKLVNIEIRYAGVGVKLLFNSFSLTNRQSMWRHSKPASSTAPKYLRRTAQPLCLAITTQTHTIYSFRKFSQFPKPKWTRWVRYFVKTFFSSSNPSDRWASVKKSWEAPFAVEKFF